MANFNTEFTTEILLFSVDAIFSIVLLQSYKKIRRYINCLQEVNAKHDSNVFEDASKERSKYIMVKGPVKAMGNTIQSMYVPNTSGVVQKLSTCELLMKRNSSGFWWEESKPLQQTYNVAPFAIVLKNNCLVQVQDVLMADELHLDIVYNKYERTVHSLAGNVWSYFFGICQYGVQTTEEMLKEGTVVTGIGTLLTLPDGSLNLMPPSEGKPYFITTQPLSSLLRDLRDKKSLLGVLLAITGSLTLVFGGLLIRRMWRNIKKRRAERSTRMRLDQHRKSRRKNVRDDDIPDNLRCVVCQENPKEVIMLPCGHLCVCEDCNEKLSTTCPICRSFVETTAAAFLS